MSKFFRKIRVYIRRLLIAADYKLGGNGSTQEHAYKWKK